MNATRIHVLLSAVALALAMPTALPAQITSKSKLDVKSVGNNDIGIDFNAWARARNTVDKRVEHQLYSPFEFLGFWGRLNDLYVRSKRTTSAFEGYYRYRVAGLTVKSVYLRRGCFRGFHTIAQAFPVDLSYEFFVGFVPITVSGNAGAGGQMNMSFLDYASNGAGMTGDTRTYAWARASAGVGVPGCQVGIQAVLRLGEQKFEGFMGAFRTWLSYSGLKYEYTPVRLLLYLFAELFDMRAELKIVDDRFGAKPASRFMY